MPELEGGVGVVVEPPHQAGIELEGDLGGRQQSGDLGEERLALGAERRADLGCPGHQAGIPLAVEEPERVHPQAAPAVLAEPVLERGVVLDQGDPVAEAIVEVPEGVDLEAQPGDAEGLIEAPGDLDDLGVQGRGALPDRLDAELPELVVAAGLGPRVAKHRPRVVHPDRPARLLQVGGEDRPQHPGGALRPERQSPAATIGEGEHLLLDHVGAGPRAPLVHLGRLEDRGVDELVAVGGHHPAVGLEQPLAEAGLGRQQVVGAPGAGDRRHRSAKSTRAAVCRPGYPVTPSSRSWVSPYVVSAPEAMAGSGVSVL